MASFQYLLARFARQDRHAGLQRAPNPRFWLHDGRVNGGRYFFGAALVLALAGSSTSLRALRVEVLTSVGGLPPHITGLFDEPSAFYQGPGGAYFVFDRRGHAVYRVEADKTAARRIVSIGQEDGRVIDPTGFDVSDDGRLVVADMPRGRQRIQVFDAEGVRTGGFTLPGQPAARVVLGGVTLNGVGTIRSARRELLLSHGGPAGLPQIRRLGNAALRASHPGRRTGCAPGGAAHPVAEAGRP